MYCRDKNVLDFQDSGWRLEVLTSGKGKIQGGRGLRPPVGAMLWTSVIYYVHIPDPIIKLLVGFIQ